MDIASINPDGWVLKYGDKLYSYAYSRLNNEDLAEDMVQETFLAGLKNLSSFQDRSSEYTWLVAILKRKVIDFYRKKSTHSEISIDAAESRFNDGKSMPGHWLQNSAPKKWGSDIQSKIEDDEFMNILNNCITKLPEKWASCFVLRMVEELSGDEVCKELNISASNLWVMLHRARLQLRECLEFNWLNN